VFIAKKAHFYKTSVCQSYSFYTGFYFVVYVKAINNPPNSILVQSFPSPTWGVLDNLIDIHKVE
jgi:hypothetical protein